MKRWIHTAIDIDMLPKFFEVYDYSDLNTKYPVSKLVYMIRDEVPDVADGIIKNFPEDAKLNVVEYVSWLDDYLEKWEADEDERIDWISSLLRYSPFE